MLKTTSQCFFILKKLLQNEEKPFNTSTELATLHELLKVMLGYDEESIKFLKELTKMECNARTVKERECHMVLPKSKIELDTSDELFYLNTCLVEPGIH